MALRLVILFDLTHASLVAVSKQKLYSRKKVGTRLKKCSLKRVKMFDAISNLSSGSSNSKWLLFYHKNFGDGTRTERWADSDGLLGSSRHPDWGIFRC